MTAPRRIQRKRTRGWRMPPGAIYVGRPSQWENPWAIRYDHHRRGWIVAHRYDRAAPVVEAESREDAMEHAVLMFRSMRSRRHDQLVFPFDLEPLRGHDLACWCPLDQPCHADVLLEMANAPPAVAA